jgi:hypothetical protein
VKINEYTYIQIFYSRYSRVIIRKKKKAKKSTNKSSSGPYAKSIKPINKNRTSRNKKK